MKFNTIVGHRYTGRVVFSMNGFDECLGETFFCGPETFSGGISEQENPDILSVLNQLFPGIETVGENFHGIDNVDKQTIIDTLKNAGAIRL